MKVAVLIHMICAVSRHDRNPGSNRVPFENCLLEYVRPQLRQLDQLTCPPPFCGKLIEMHDPASFIDPFGQSDHWGKRRHRQCVHSGRRILREEIAGGGRFEVRLFGYRGASEERYYFTVIVDGA
jgi:hypothetical protein